MLEIHLCQIERIAGRNPPEKEADIDVSVRAFEGGDVGSLAYARVIEGLHYLRYNARQVAVLRFNNYLRPDLHLGREGDI